MEFTEGKRYNSYAGHWRRIFGERLQKLVIDAGFTCPNRDGSLGTGGCSFCDNAAFHPGYSTPEKPILVQIDEGIEFHRIRYPRAKHYLAYFQAYSNTYGTLEKMRQAYETALSHPSVVGIVIGTRPDCVDGKKLDYLEALSKGKVLKDWRRDLCRIAPGDPETATSGGKETLPQELTAPVVVIEYGIESCHDTTLKRVNRGHDFACAKRAVEMTAAKGLDCCAHFILGLPGESRQMLADQSSLISSLPLTSVKFHQLQIVKGTRMEADFAKNPQDFYRPGLDEYLDLVIDILERLRPDLFIERVAGEVPPRFVNGTPWGLVRNLDILRRLDERLEERGSWQGRLHSI